MGARAGAPVTIAPRPYVVVPGTWAYADLDNPRAWWQRGSAWSAFLAAAGGLYAMRPLDPFLWSTDLEGFPWPWRRRALDRNEWDAGGRSLRYYLEAVAPADRTVITHSHGAQVAAYAAAGGLSIARLITVAAPVRGDVDPVWRAARPNIGDWLNIYLEGDAIQIGGAFGDRVIRWARAMKYPGVVNHGVPGVRGHSALFEDPACFELWRSQGWIDFARGAGR